MRIRDDDTAPELAWTGGTTSTAKPSSVPIAVSVAGSPDVQVESAEQGDEQRRAVGTDRRLERGHGFSRAPLLRHLGSLLEECRRVGASSLLGLGL